MATLQKFKHFATQCGAATGNPTQSPTTSPVIHLRRRKTLRMLLSRSSTTPSAVDHHRRAMAMFDQGQQRDLPADSKRARRKLKDLFVSSPPPFDDNRSKNRGCDEVRLLTGSEGAGGVGRVGIGGNSNGSISFSRGSGGGGGGFSGGRRRGGLRQGAATFRYRLLRRAWRPVLVTIPE